MHMHSQHLIIASQKHQYGVNFILLQTSIAQLALSLLYD